MRIKKDRGSPRDEQCTLGSEKQQNQLRAVSLVHFIKEKNKQYTLEMTKKKDTKLQLYSF